MLLTAMLFFKHVNKVCEVIIMAAGSWLRYIVGILLSLDVLRIALTGSQLQQTTIALAVVFLILAALYVVKSI